MNIWSLFKHKSVKLLLFCLQKELEQNKLSIEREEGNDYFAVTLIKPEQPDLRAYIYTYGQTRNLYGIHLEYPWFIENGFNDSIQVYEDLSVQQIIRTLMTHFEVINHEMVV